MIFNLKYRYKKVSSLDLSGLKKIAGGDFFRNEYDSVDSLPKGRNGISIGDIVKIQADSVQPLGIDYGVIRGNYKHPSNNLKSYIEVDLESGGRVNLSVGDYNILDFLSPDRYERDKSNEWKRQKERDSDPELYGNWRSIV